MDKLLEPGLGEMLRYLVDIVDRGSETRYRGLGLPFRPRYTPVMRALSVGVCTVKDITDRVHITQGAVSQTVKLMEADGLVIRRASDIDGRQTTMSLTPKGLDLLKILEIQWSVLFKAVEGLEKETGVFLRDDLQKIIGALENTDFEARLMTAAQTPNSKSTKLKSSRHNG